MMNRRELLKWMGAGTGALGLAATAFGQDPFAAKTTRHPARAKRLIHLFMNGGPSQVDTFDPKPALTKYQGQRPPATA